MMRHAHSDCQCVHNVCERESRTEESRSKQMSSKTKKKKEMKDN